MPRSSIPGYQELLEENERQQQARAKKQRANILRCLVAILQRHYPHESCDGYLRAGRVIVHAAVARMERDSSYNSLLTAAKDELEDFREMFALDLQDHSGAFASVYEPRQHPQQSGMPQSAPAK
jgi:hypothetical protein